MRVVVLLGGDSEERDVSLASGAQVANGLRSMGHDVLSLDPTCGLLELDQEENLLKGTISQLPPVGVHTTDSSMRVLEHLSQLRAADIVFPVLHGGIGENGTIQAVLDFLGIPYVGSDMLGCALSMNKDATKRLLRASKIFTPDWVLASTIDEVMRALSFPFICKPVDGGSSVGITLVTNEEALRKCFDPEQMKGRTLMCETFVPGRELTVGVVGEETLPIGEIIVSGEIFDYECKYRPEMADEIFPAELDGSVTAMVSRIALEVHRALGLRDLSRIDFILDRNGKLWCLEANSLPGMTTNSLLPKAAESAGFSFGEFCERLLVIAMKRNKKNS